ncbi:MHYT domain-containing protein, partial [Escherichia coli]|uniref:MHYT domain-containing protein n=1 Tax=Escherichia coli TaxID=562 RepID=UPI0033139DEB
MIAVLASGVALWIAFRLRRQSRRVRALRAGSAVVMGVAIVGMHYTGMAALRMNPGIQYNPGRFGVSVVIAVLASGVALWIAFRLRRQSRRVRALRAG